MAQLRPNTQLRRSLNRIGEAIRQMKATVTTMNVTEAETGTARAAAGGGAGAGVDFVADEVAVTVTIKVNASYHALFMHKEGEHQVPLLIIYHFLLSPLCRAFCVQK